MVYIFKYINLDNQFVIKSITRSFIMLNSMMEMKAQVLLIFWSLSWDQRDRNISKPCVFILHHSIQHDKGSGHNLHCLHIQKQKWSKHRSLGDTTSNIFKICFAIFTYINVLLSVSWVNVKPGKIFVNYAITFLFFSVRWHDQLQQMPLRSQ